MDSLTILKSLVSHLEPRRAEWIQAQRNGRGHYFHQHESFGKNYVGAVYNLDKMINSKYMSWYDIYFTMCCYLFQNIKIPYKSYSIPHGGSVNCEEIYEYLNRFISDNGKSWEVDLYKYRIPLGNDNSPGARYRDELSRSLSEVNIPVSSVKEYLEYLITLEEKYSVNPENIVRYKGDIEKADTMLKEREEREKKKAEENERARLEYEKKEAERKERIRIQREKKEKEKKEEEERKKAEEEVKAFEAEVERRVKLELYERRVKAEVERRLKELDVAQEEIIPPVVEEVADVKVEEVADVKVEEVADVKVEEVADVKVEEVKEEVKDVAEVKPVSILERLKKFF